jgi:serine/threonine-protein kinase
MEYIEGEPLTEYCDQRRLSVKERLDLFQTICDAVQHAHQNLIVHRDLKPKNILVTAEGAPKLLDFGIGKVLASSDTLGPAVETKTDVRVLTPEYAAPEQITGGPVTTATDVYGLGLLLFELLAGRHPYLAGGETIQEIERAILDAVPTRPSVVIPSAEARSEVTGDSVSERRGTNPHDLRRRLAGDLDNIVLKALRKEPERRYASAAAMAEDIQRHLDGHPISARPDTIGYRARKFIRRNAAGVAVTVTAFLALAATTIVTLIQSGRVRREAERVTRERDKALEVRGFLLEMFGASGANRAVGDTITARGLLDVQVTRLRTAYDGRPELKAEMMEVLADGYDRLGLYQEAEPLARQTVELRRTTLGDRHPDVAAALNLLGWIVHERGQSKDAEPILKESIAIHRVTRQAKDDGLSKALNDLGVVYNELSRYREAESVLVESLAIRRAGLGDDHRAVGITANNLAAAFYYQGKLDTAISIQDFAVGSLSRSVGPDHQRTIVALGNAAAFKRALGQWDAAEASYRELLARQTKLQGRDHPVTARTITQLATVLTDRNTATAAARAEGEQLLREALAIQETKLGAAHPNVATTLDRLAGVVADLGDPKAALPLQERALAIHRAAFGELNASTAASTARLAIIHWQLGKVPDALRLERAAIEGFEKSVGPDHLETARHRNVLCGWTLTAGENPAAVEDLCGKAEASFLKAPERNRGLLPLIRLRRAAARILQGRGAAADSILRLVKSDLGDGTDRPYERRFLDSLTAVLAKGPTGT